MDTSRIRNKLSDSTVVKKSTAFYEKHRRMAPLVSFIAGFTWDSLTLTRIDRLWDNVVLLLYLTLLGLTLFLMHLTDNNKIENKRVLKYREWFPSVIQFFFGGLFSAYVVFYFQSAALSKSWIFIFLLILLMVGNEFIKDRFSGLRVYLPLYFLAIFSFFTFFVPVVIKIMNLWVFLLSGFISLAVMAGFVRLLFRFDSEQNAALFKQIALTVLSIYILLNFFYFLNWIPPVPLSLKEGGIYHHIHKTNGMYEMRFETGSWYRFWKHSDDVFHYAPGDTVFCFTSVFAPTKLDKKIVHHWQIYEKKPDRWQTTDRRAYRIVGGRDGGFRGYSFKKNIQPGTWRVDVETAEGLLLGRIGFEVVTASEAAREQTTIIR